MAKRYVMGDEERAILLKNGWTNEEIESKIDRAFKLDQREEDNIALIDKFIAKDPDSNPSSLPYLRIYEERKRQILNDLLKYSEISSFHCADELLKLNDKSYAILLEYMKERRHATFCEKTKRWVKNGT